MKTTLFTIALLLCACGKHHGGQPDFAPIVGIYHCTVTYSSGPDYPWTVGQAISVMVTDDGHLHLGAYDVPMTLGADGVWHGTTGPLGMTWDLYPNYQRINSQVPGNGEMMTLSYTLPVG